MNEFREADLLRHNATRTLWLDSPDLPALLELAKDAEGVARALTDVDKAFLDHFYLDCRDYKIEGMTRTMLGRPFDRR